MNLANSVGAFREGEIDGKKFLIHTWLSPKDSPSSSSSSSSLPSGEVAIDSGEDVLPTDQPLFICPSMRMQCWSPTDYFVPVKIPPDQLPFYMLHSNYSCKLPLQPFFWSKEDEYPRKTFSNFCHACNLTCSDLRKNYYYCDTCVIVFHEDCVRSPLEFKHPSYPFISFKLYTEPWDSKLKCLCCDIPIHGISYFSPTYNFSLSLLCAFKPIPFVIEHPKKHPHPLTYSPKHNFLPCHVCGLIKEFIPTYVCVGCVFVVHQDCINFPLVIRIRRHQHLISYTSSLPSGKLSCGVCCQKIDNDYGAYSCNSKCDDGYFVHSKCALRRDLWDGKELEGIPEEPEIIVDPFVRIDDGIILHFSHGHNLKLEMSEVYDQHKFCQACVLPIYDGRYYSCLDGCDFILHEACVSAPCKKYHQLDASPLTLLVATYNVYDNVRESHFRCDACQRESCGFLYKTIGKYPSFTLCLHCASVSEPFEYQGHKHPLFLDFDPEEEKSAVCYICQEVGGDDRYSCRKLKCMECNFVICFKCATLPYKARYQHDSHFLTFYQAKEAKEHSEWCDVCERKIGDSREKGFYSCDDCCTTLHINCLLGEDMYMKPGQTLEYLYSTSRSTLYILELHILRNNTLSRPSCSQCGERCRQKVVFKYKTNYLFCTVSCQKNLMGSPIGS